MFNYMFTYRKEKEPVFLYFRSDEGLTLETLAL